MKKRLAMLFALCLMTGVLSSCGKDSGSTETTKKDDNTLVILNYGKYIDESVLAVSYTHLDVYKRQAFQSADIFSDFFCHCR